jgi:hypothetical protein
MTRMLERVVNSPPECMKPIATSVPLEELQLWTPTSVLASFVGRI